MYCRVMVHIWYQEILANFPLDSNYEYLCVHAPTHCSHVEYNVLSSQKYTNPFDYLIINSSVVSKLSIALNILESMMVYLF